MIAPTPAAEPIVARAKALAEYLKQHPNAEGKTPAQLAGEFALEESFVTQVMRGLTVSNPPRLGQMPRIHALRNLLQSVWRGVRGVMMHSFFFATLTLGLSYVALLASVLESTPKGWAVNLESSLQRPFQVFFGVFVAHFVSFFISGDLRAAFRTTGVLGLSILFVSGLLPFIQGGTTGGVGQLLLHTNYALYLVIPYWILATLSAATGAMAQYWRQDRDEVHQTRQQLLERLFDLQNRFASASPARVGEGSNILPPEIRRFFAKHPLRASLGYGLFSGLAYLSLGNASRIDFGTLAATGRAGLLITDFVAHFAMGFTAKSLLEAWVRTIVAHGVVILIFLLPINGFGYQSYLSESLLRPIVGNSVVYLILSSVGWMVASLDERAGAQARLERNEPAALLAEIVKVEWRLKARSQQVALVSVDAAKSAEMKSACDPLIAEYSFREYQEFLRHITAANKGFVYSTAGDGAILAFTSVADAFLAAKEIQTGISYFNEHVNKLPVRFRLRVGLHSGEISGDIREVEFAEVIDATAHIQEAAPIRGILVSKPAAVQLEGESLIPLKDPVDGYEVFLAYNPTVEM